MNLFDELTAVLTCLAEQRIDYALVGALAVAVHGAPRATTDIDLLVEASVVEDIAELVEDLGFRFRSMPVRFSDGMELVRLTKIEDGDTLTLDLLVVNENLRSTWQSRTWYETDFGRVCAVARDALIAMKVAAGRAQDLADVERLDGEDR